MLTPNAVAHICVYHCCYTVQVLYCTLVLLVFQFCPFFIGSWVLSFWGAGATAAAAAASSSVLDKAKAAAAAASKSTSIGSSSSSNSTSSGGWWQTARAKLARERAGEYATLHSTSASNC
jgi:hypothetical protein